MNCGALALNYQITALAPNYRHAIAQITPLKSALFKIFRPPYPLFVLTGNSVAVRRSTVTESAVVEGADL